MLPSIPVVQVFMHINLTIRTASELSRLIAAIVTHVRFNAGYWAITHCERNYLTTRATWLRIWLQLEFTTTLFFLLIK